MQFFKRQWANLAARRRLIMLVSGSAIVAEVLEPVYGALGLDFDPAGVGSLEDEVPGIGRSEVEHALLRQFELLAGPGGMALEEVALDPATFEEAESRAVNFSSNRTS